MYIGILPLWQGVEVLLISAVVGSKSTSMVYRSLGLIKVTTPAHYASYFAMVVEFLIVHHLGTNTTGCNTFSVILHQIWRGWTPLHNATMLPLILPCLANDASFFGTWTWLPWLPDHKSAPIQNFERNYPNLMPNVATVSSTQNQFYVAPLCFL